MRIRVSIECVRCGRSRPKAAFGRCHTCYQIVRKESVKRKLLNKQKNRCAIKGCMTDTSNYTLKNWQLDHDHRCCKSGHTCGKCYRGLLCRRCNFMIGMIENNGDKVLKGIEPYLGGS